ncbi:hypothetical protein [Agrobacterium tumefaciens]|uniref:Uncharacterized protein n=1 Tax=Agrobacterium tumefaciens TaxID=358 RepID=A0AA44F2T5_AGRTU|nr:hypothetical protein [Agrobacterium tumefaciens]NSL21663.1 hypothetical protein [Agrobacterium tumefaciens]NTC16645.1 hypothetical protein [Agrobacterium tumefaciens]NTC28035.1 hypothetical protein [Agrobacterium tumefaciens]NTC58313.1 hypothetical protein [Agrobacterium tumefaciens]NTC60186.1 hypothetical protein [Agrobacterium tumefaciens]
MMNQPAAMNGPPITKRLVDGIEHRARMSGPACPPGAAIGLSKWQIVFIQSIIEVYKTGSCIYLRYQ